MEKIRKSLKDYIVGLRHIGHVVPDLKAAIASFKKVYGVTDMDIQVIPDFTQDAPTRFAFIKVGGTEFELIEPISDDFKEMLQSSPSGAAGINHVAYTVSDIEAAYDGLKAQNIRAGHVTPDGIVKMGKNKMVYLDPATTDGLLIELIEENCG